MLEEDSTRQGKHIHTSPKNSVWFGSFVSCLVKSWSELEPESLIGSLMSCRVRERHRTTRAQGLLAEFFPALQLVK